MDDGLALDAIIVFLDDGGAIARFVLLHNDSAIMVTIAVPVMAFTDSYTCTDGPNPNTNVIGECRSCETEHGCANQKILFHVLFPLSKLCGFNVSPFLPFP